MSLAAYFLILAEAVVTPGMHSEEIACCKRLMGRIAGRMA